MNFQDIIKKKISSSEYIYSLGLGEPHFETPHEIINETILSLQKGMTHYSDCMGLFKLRDKIAHKLNEENGIKTNPDNIGVTFGAKQALFVSLLSLLDSPDYQVINISPSYISYEPQIKIANPNCKIFNIELNKNDFSLDFDAISKTVNDKTRVLILNSPNNPTGIMYSNEDIKRFLDIILPYKNLYVISDEIYEYLTYSEKKHISIASYDEISERVFTINGFSKPFNMTGWRIGYFNFPQSFKKAIANILLHINTNVTTFVQYGAIKAFEIDGNYMKSYRNELKQYVSILKRELGDDEKIKIILPEGGLFTFANIEKLNVSSIDFVNGLLDAENVAVNSGNIYGESWNKYIRISFGCSLKDFEIGILKLKKYLEENF